MCSGPGAGHSRFEHSIGVSYLAGQFIEQLQQRQQELNITETEVLCIKVAGLVHVRACPCEFRCTRAQMSCIHVCIDMRPAGCICMCLRHVCTCAMRHLTESRILSTVRCERL